MAKARLPVAITQSFLPERRAEKGPRGTRDDRRGRARLRGSLSSAAQPSPRRRGDIIGFKSMLRDHEGGDVMGRGERGADGFPARILLATDGSECAALATRAALDLASRGGSELHVVHVWLDIHTSHFHAYVRRELHREGQEILDAQVGEIEASGGAVAGAHLMEGHSVGEVLALADELDAGLVVVGSRGMGPIHRLLLGSVSEGLAHRTTRPLLVVRGPWPPARVVIGDDFTEGAREAGDLAARVGALLGAEVALARVYPQAQGTAPEEANASLD